jgi:hypothetical protein
VVGGVVGGVVEVGIVAEVEMVAEVEIVAVAAFLESHGLFSNDHFALKGMCVILLCALKGMCVI